MNASFLAQKFQAALNYKSYVLTGTDEQQRRWKQVYDAAKITPEQGQLLSGFTRKTHVLVISGIWCGDCVQQCPLQQRIAEGNEGMIDLRFVDRDQNRDLESHVRMNAGDRVPVALFMAEDFELCGVYGDRVISRYRAMARKQLGASCPIGLAPPDADEMAATLADWVQEFERIQLMLRLSGRLRQKHGD